LDIAGDHFGRTTTRSFIYKEACPRRGNFYPNNFQETQFDTGGYLYYTYIIAEILEPYNFEVHLFC